jgi:hypothetical protein
MGIVAGSSPLRRLFRGRAATYGTATILLALGELVLAAPQAPPGLTITGHQPHVTASMVLMRIRVSIRDGRRTVCPSRSSGGSAFRKGSAHDTV